jgi:uncharacterized coiled-coil protein SlyX
LKTVSTFCVALSLVVSSTARAAPTLDELWQIVQSQQQQIASLQRQLDAATAKLAAAESGLVSTQQQVAATDAKVEATADALDSRAATVPGKTAASWAERTTVGGYAELHYNNLDDHATAADGGADDVNMVDLHRFVIFLSHRFSDRLRFASELEVEHAVAAEDTEGEVEVEQAWVEFDLNPRHHLRAGVDVLPIGIINQTHEPNTFYGVERNPIETEIIPSTWWEAALAATGELGAGFSYDLYLHSGLSVPTAGDSPFRIRDGRQEVSEASDQDLAVTGRLKYTAIPGLELAVALQYQADYTGTADAADVGATLFEAHADWRHASGLGLRALYARWDLDRDRTHGVDPDAVGAGTLDGWYVEPSYRFALPHADLGEIGIFARYNQWDEYNRLAGMDFRYVRMDRVNVGFNYWPHPQVVLKFDAQWEDADGSTDRELDGFNLGLGLQF